MCIQTSDTSTAGLSPQPTADGVRMTLKFDAMHSDEWTERAVMGWKIELGKADALMAARTVGGQS